MIDDAEAPGSVDLFAFERAHVRVIEGEGALDAGFASALLIVQLDRGAIRSHQLDFAERVFADASDDEAKIVVAHHHFVPAPDYEGDTQIPRARQILDAFEAMGVELIFGGHLHRAYIGNSLDVYPGKDRRHGVVIVQSGTTTSGRGRAREQAKNSFNVARIAKDHLEVTHYMYFEEIDGFAPFSMHAFPRRAKRYFPYDPFRTVIDAPGKGVA